MQLDLEVMAIRESVYIFWSQDNVQLWYSRFQGSQNEKRNSEAGWLWRETQMREMNLAQVFLNSFCLFPCRPVKLHFDSSIGERACMLLVLTRKILKQIRIRIFLTTPSMGQQGYIKGSRLSREDMKCTCTHYRTHTNTHSYRCGSIKTRGCWYVTVCRSGSSLLKCLWTWVLRERGKNMSVCAHLDLIGPFTWRINDSSFQSHSSCISYQNVGGYNSLFSFLMALTADNWREERRSSPWSRPTAI